MAKKGIVRKLTLREISAVDNPAQEGARVVIMKRAETAEGGEGVTMTAEEETKLKKDLADLKAKTESQEAEVIKLKAEKEEAGKMAELTDEEKAHMATLSKEEGAAYMKKSKTERKQIILTKNAGEEIIKVDGREIRKSVVGSDVFAVLKSQQDAIASNKVALEKAQKDTQTAELKKRASDELSKLPGTEDEKVEMLRSIEAMPENVRKAALAALKAGNQAIAKGFETFGSEGGEPANIHKSKQDFEAKVSEIQKRDSVSRTVAMERATDAHPELWQAAYGDMREVPNAGRRASSH